MKSNYFQPVTGYSCICNRVLSVDMIKMQSASFRDFLATGTLGPLSPDMKLVDVAKALGSPDGWNVEEDEFVPLYWFFGKLEISFGSSAPYGINWFQIEDAPRLKGRYEPLTQRLKLSLDGFTGETRPSEFLSAGLWDPKMTTVYYAGLSDDILLNLCAGRVQIHFRVDASFIGNREAIQYLSESTPSRVVRDINSRTKVDSIYSYPQPAAEEAPGVFDWRSLTGQDYLDLLR